ncbi:MAG: serine/threonine-protein kinase, partial [Pirellulaceae bacterium]
MHSLTAYRHNLQIIPMNPTPPRQQQRFLKLDEVCDQFEQSWQSGQDPSLAAALEQVTDSDQASLLSDLLPIELRYRLARGEQLKMSQYQQQLPEHAEAIREVFLRLQNAANDTLANKQQAQFHATMRMGKLQDLEASTLQPGTSESQVLVSLEEIGSEFGDYELLDEIGRGGMGVVYRARQKSLDREVAVKMILAGGLADEESIARFYAEAQAVGRLRHPNIVQVYEVGQHKGHHFFSMDYIQGQSLSEVMRSRPVTAKEAAAYVRTIAEAVHSAHEAGIIHRDLKPANILTDDTAQPLITDFGLAKRTEDDSGLTRTGKIMGTPSYMPPEQIGSGDEPISPASDTYALGAILYELLTGRPPFRGESSMETLLQVLQQEPVAPCVLAPKLDLDLETITLKCLEKKPALRYESAQALADELGRYLKGQPIKARPVTWMERSWRWCKRKPVAAAIGSLLLLLMLILSIGGPLAAWKQRVLLFDVDNAVKTAKRQRIEADQRRKDAVAAQREAEEQKTKAQNSAAAKSHQVYVADMRLAGRYWDSGDTANVLTILERHRAEVEQDPSYRFELHYLDRLCHSAQQTLTGHTSAVYCLAITADGSRLASGGRDGVRIWDIATGKQLIHIPDIPIIFSVAFSPDGQLLAAGGEGYVIDGKRPDTLNIWDWQKKELTQTFSDYYNGDSSCWSKTSYSPDGRLIAYPAQDGTIKVAEVATGKHVAILKGHKTKTQRVAFSPDGKRIVSSDYFSPHDQNIKIWDWAAGKEILTLAASGYVSDVAFGPQGKWLAASVGGSADSAVRVWKLESGDKVTFSEQLTGLRRRIRPVAFSPDGNSLAAAGFGDQIGVWPLPGRDPQQVFSGHRGDVHEVVFHPDGKRVFSCSDDQSIKVWDRTQRQGSVSLEGKRYGGGFVAFSPDGTQVAMASSGLHEIGIWDVKTQKKIVTLLGHVAPVLSVMFSPSGKQLVSGGRDNTVRLWDTSTGQPLYTLTDHKDAVWEVAFSPDGTLVASASYDGTARVWKTLEGRTVSVFRGHADPRPHLQDLAFSPDGKQVASVGYDTVVRIWDPKSGVELSTLKPTSGYILESVVFSPDGSQLVVGDAT